MMKNNNSIRFAIVGCGLMGREFASAAARWIHLSGDIPTPQIIAVCDPNKSNQDWFRNVPSVKYFYSDYAEMLKNEEVEAVYCAIPHNLHSRVYSDIIRAGKHLLGEKPFGFDQGAFEEIEAAMKVRPEVFVRCSSEFPFYPAAQQLVRWYEEGRFGRIIEARFSIKHSSDMDVNKPINWKRIVAINGKYGCMGDLGIHTQHIPFRLGMVPGTVSAELSKLVSTRPDRNGVPVPCETYDNALLLCGAKDKDNDEFPMIFEMKRMAPGCTNTVQYEIYGMEMSAVFTTDDPNAIQFTLNQGREQSWSRLVVGHKPLFPVITGNIFEFGFSDSLLQMFAAFASELRGLPCSFGCFRPEEVKLSHRLLTAALASYEQKCVVNV